jgi:hypothetical protein
MDIWHQGLRADSKIYENKIADFILYCMLGVCKKNKMLIIEYASE